MRILCMQTRTERYLPEFIYGGIDGAVTTFAVVSGALGATLSPAVVIILGFANLFADGFSMAVSNYLSVKSSRDLEERDGAAQAYEKSPLATATATFVAFVLIGLVPLSSFVLAPIWPWAADNTFGLAMGLTAVAFFAVGWGKGVVTETSRLRAGLVTLAIGGAAAAIAFGVGYLLRGFA